MTISTEITMMMKMPLNSQSSIAMTPYNDRHMICRRSYYSFRRFRLAMITSGWIGAGWTRVASIETGLPDYWERPVILP